MLPEFPAGSHHLVNGRHCPQKDCAVVRYVDGVRRCKTEGLQP